MDRFRLKSGVSLGEINVSSQLARHDDVLSNRAWSIQCLAAHSARGKFVRSPGTVVVQILANIFESAHISNRVEPVTHPEHVVYMIEGSDEYRRGDRKSTGTYNMILGVSESHEK